MLFHVQVMSLVLDAEEQRRQLRVGGFGGVVFLTTTTNVFCGG